MASIVNMHEFKTHLSRLVARAAPGEEMVIARAGRPVARLGTLAEPASTPRLGFLHAQAVAKVNLKRAFAGEIDAMFAGH